MRSSKDQHADEANLRVAGEPFVDPGSSAALPNTPRRSIGLVPNEIAALILMAGIAVLLTLVLLEIQTSMRAYIVGESHWSKAEQDAAHLLHRYAQSGNPDQLLALRNSLAVPLGDRQARLALEQTPPDLAAAHAGFLQGNNAEADVGRMARMYRYLRDAPYFRDSVQRWREGDAGVLELVRLADEMEVAHAAGALSEAQIADFQNRALVINQRLRPIEIGFSKSLVDGARLLTTILVVLSILTFIMLACAMTYVFRVSLRRIRDSEGAFRAAFHQAAVGMLKTDVEGRIVEANEAIGRILGIPLVQLYRMRLDELRHRTDTSGRDIEREGSAESASEHPFVRSDGSTRWLRWTLSMLDLEPGKKRRLFAIVEDVSESRRLAQEMGLSIHDALPADQSPRDDARLQQTVARSRDRDQQHAFLFLDLDQFKLVNDNCGHAAGDRLLCQVAGILLLQMRGSDWMGRLGGDEFAVLLEQSGIDDALRIVQRLVRALAESTFHWEGNPFTITCSIGIVGITGAEDDVGYILRAADRACYQAKEDGRNCIRVYHESDQAMRQRRDEMAWIADIRTAIAKGRIQLYAQRIEALDGTCGLQYEILVRLIDASGTVFSPDTFLPAAERFGEAIAIDRVVVALTLAELESNPEHLRDLELCHLNVSAQSIASSDFRHHVAGLLDASTVPARKLCFEITETAAIANIAQAREFINDMRSRGCRVALDDFGNGHASFAYLKNLPADILKIDGVFIRDLANNAVDPVLVRSMCEVARSLGKTTVAEWVEDRRLLPILRQLGVDRAQGHAIHEPCPLREIMAESNVERARLRPGS